MHQQFLLSSSISVSDRKIFCIKTKKYLVEKQKNILHKNKKYLVENILHVPFDSHETKQSFMQLEIEKFWIYFDDLCCFAVNQMETRLVERKHRKYLKTEPPWLYTLHYV